MKSFCLAVLCITVILFEAGCERVSAPYIMKMDRHDQNLASGNKGYLKGTPPPQKDRGDLKREFIAIDIDLVSPRQSQEAAGEAEAIEKREAASAARPAPKEEVK